MKKILSLIFLIFLVFSCEVDDTKTYNISIRNDSNFTIYDISIEMELLPTGLPDSLHIDSLLVNNETDKFKFFFDRNSSSGCKGTGISLLASFEGTYTPNDSLKWYYAVMDDRESNYVIIVIDNESYYILEN